MLDAITPVILTLNEAPNIGRTLEMLSWAKCVVVVDSLSDDETVSIARGFPNVQVVQRKFDAHALQWNYALSETEITSDWILALDADYVLTPGLIEELRDLRPAEGVCGFWARFEYCVFGKPLRGSVYPPVVALYRRTAARYLQDGHTQRIQVDGELRTLASPIRHDDRKPLARWIASQSRYMKLEADKLAQTELSALTIPDRIRRTIVLAPPLVFLYALLAKGAILDGRAGLYYALQRTAAEMLLSLYLLQRYLEGE